MTAGISVQNLFVAYDDLVAVSDVSFTVPPGYVLAVSGPSGVSGRLQPKLLVQFAFKRLEGCLTSFHTSAWSKPELDVRQLAVQ
jgi:ABC-type phosphonate transport system ATPase subunit